MARPKASDGAGIVEPDMTPMIDIVFQLLTFFMVVINFENQSADERVKLPKDLLAKPPESRPDDELLLNFGYERSDGRKMSNKPVIFLPGSNVTLADVGPFLKQEVTVKDAKGGQNAHKKVAVIIRADAETPSGLIKELMRECQRVGFEKFSLKAIQEE